MLDLALALALALALFLNRAANNRNGCGSGWWEKWWGCLFLLNNAHKANDASSYWRNDCMLTWLHEILGISLLFALAWRTDGLMDGRRFLVSLIYLLEHLFAWKCWFPLFLTKAWPTDRRTDRPTYRDARTHLKSDRYTQQGTHYKTIFTWLIMRKRLMMGLRWWGR